MSKGRPKRKFVEKGDGVDFAAESGIGTLPFLFYKFLRAKPGIDMRAPKRILFAFCVHSRNGSVSCLNCYELLHKRWALWPLLL